MDSVTFEKTTVGVTAHTYLQLIKLLMAD